MMMRRTPRASLTVLVAATFLASTAAFVHGPAGKPSVGGRDKPDISKFRDFDGFRSNEGGGGGGGDAEWGVGLNQLPPPDRAGFRGTFGRWVRGLLDDLNLSKALQGAKLSLALGWGRVKTALTGAMLALLGVGAWLKGALQRRRGPEEGGIVSRVPPSW